MVRPTHEERDTSPTGEKSSGTFWKLLGLAVFFFSIKRHEKPEKYSGINMQRFAALLTK